ncbi:MAG: ion transporter [Candidatus Kapabacteria bacterium]|nr:ion transporter [Candidatus Kapabacteria bacterium]
MITQRIHQVLTGQPPSRTHDFVSKVLLFSILASVACIVIESEPGLSDSAMSILSVADQLFLVLFSVEYLLRLWSCVAEPEYADPLWGRLRYMLRPMMIIDLLAIAPMILLGMGLDLRSLRMFRLVRLFRVLKMSRYISAVERLGRVFQRQRSQLSLAFGVVMFLLLLSSTLMYEVEHDAQPQAFSSISATMWWAVASLTTVGYGDIYPITPLGKFLAGIVAILGVGLVALPAGILASGFSEVSEEDHRSRKCPQCGCDVE